MPKNKSKKKRSVMLKDCVADTALVQALSTAARDGMRLLSTGESPTWFATARCVDARKYAKSWRFCKSVREVRRHLIGRSSPNGFFPVGQDSQESGLVLS